MKKSANSSYKYSHIRGYKDLKTEQRIIRSGLSGKGTLIGSQLEIVKHNLSPIRLLDELVERLTSHSSFFEVAVRSYNLIRSIITSHHEDKEE